MADDASIEVSSQLDAREVEQVMSVHTAATDADGVSPLSEHVLLHLRYGGQGPDRHLLLYAGDTLAGYAHLDPTDAVMGAAAELVVHPEHRKRGYGRMLVASALDLLPDGRLRLWAHGDHPAAHALAGSLGFQVVRVLWQMRRSLLAPLPQVSMPEGVHLRTFRPGQDEEDWLALNARAFADHPEQGGWTHQDLSARMQEDWFDPRGFLIAEDDGPQGRRMVAFHWTKVHGGDPVPQRGSHPAPLQHGHEPIGEVYVVGVSPDAQGRGLGKAVTVAGLRWLRSLGLRQAMLYVEADNGGALRVYEKLGFTHWDTDVMFSRPVGR